ncbi:hypothetical protein HME9304_01106 [Flagellimonas maritima]|uniref:DUF4296 domain-containing protein n=2 Tax=Flagellimonas maritima TaxID=1383885 RepID=A0A2Z4LQL5_9FLAO|nr:hypothetical protein HME9304_01106 [Allomuricauda aurantiaca]
MFLPLLGLLFFSCGEKVVEKPENLIPKDKMVNILYDLSILKASKSSYRNMMDEVGIETMDFLYKKYQIDSAQLSQSNLYYASLPLEYQAIYEEIEAILKEKHAALEETTQNRNDSIAKTRKVDLDSIKRPSTTKTGDSINAPKT